MANNYIVTINDEIRDLKVLNWRDLYHAKFTFNEKFQINLADEEIILAEQVIRIIPKRRIVAFGTWRDKPVVVKLFFDPSQAKKHMEQDVAGMKLLRDFKIPRPYLYYQGVSEDRRIHILIFERIFKANNLAELWTKKHSLKAMFPILQAIVKEIATQHVLGVLQQDLHLKNFLLTKKKIYTLDGAQIEHYPFLLPKKISINNLALFLSQLGVGIEDYQEKLFRYYAHLRGWILTEDDMLEYRLAIKHWHHRRWQKFEKKIFRNCSNYGKIKHGISEGMYDRSYANKEFMDFLKNPESAFDHPNAVILKDGNSATVIKVTINQCDLVVKRYNLKNIWHRLRRCLRTTRARHAWRLAQKLHFFGIATAKPVAFLERRILGFKGKSYFVTEFVSDLHAGTKLKIDLHEDKQSLVQAITSLLKSVAKLHVTHGDLKVTNILINKEALPVLIDLDGASEHRSLSGLRHAWRKEVKRFLNNFKDDPDLQESFTQSLMISQGKGTVDS